jgi:polygalacturonase
MDSIYLGQLGGGKSAWAALEPPEKPAGYPEADMFGTLPATGFFLRHARNLQLSNIEIATEAPDARPSIWADEVEDLDVFRLRAPKSAPAYSLRNVRNFRNFGAWQIADRTEASIEKLQF